MSIRLQSADHRGMHCEYCESTIGVLPIVIDYGEGYRSIGSIICGACLLYATAKAGVREYQPEFGGVDALAKHIDRRE